MANDKPKRRRGRPARLEQDPGLGARIIEHVRNGNFAETAAQAEGVSPVSLCEWQAWGAEGREPYAAFSEELARAFALAEMDMVSLLRNPPLDSRGRADGSWLRAVGWLLERTRHGKFGVKIEVVAKEQAVHDILQLLSTGLDPQEYSKVLRVLGGADGASVPSSAREPSGAVH